MSGRDLKIQITKGGLRTFQVLLGNDEYALRGFGEVAVLGYGKDSLNFKGALLAPSGNGMDSL